MVSEPIKALGFAGSLRKCSYNRMLLNAADELKPEGMTIEKFDLEGIPPFNQDLEKDNVPERVQLFKSKIKAADVIIIATPEYNYSIPGVLKNAIDSASRPYGDNSFDKKPIGIMSAAIGMLGGARAQYHLRQTMVFLNAYPLNSPEVIVPFAAQKFNIDGKLTDLYTQTHIQKMLAALVKWAGLINQGVKSELI